MGKLQVEGALGRLEVEEGIGYIAGRRWHWADCRYKNVLGRLQVEEGIW